MKILAIDSSSLTASVAIVEDELTIAEYTVNYKKTHSQTLLPMLDEIVKMTEQELGSIDAIAVAAGPGSFTGLRIGSATVKGLAQAFILGEEFIGNDSVCLILGDNIFYGKDFTRTLNKAQQDMNGAVIFNITVIVMLI